MRGEENRKGFYPTSSFLFFPWRMERAPVRDYLSGVDQGLPGRLITIRVLEEATLPLDQALNLRSISWAFSTAMPFGACDFLFNRHGHTCSFLPQFCLY